MSNNNHGGARKGAGRKPKDTVQLSLKVERSVIEGLNKKYPVIENRNEVIKQRLREILNIS